MAIETPEVQQPLHWRVEEFFSAMPGGTMLLDRVRTDEAVLLFTENTDHPLVTAIRSQWQVSWDQYKLNFAAYVPRIIADLLVWIIAQTDADRSVLIEPVPEWAQCDLAAYRDLVAGYADELWFSRLLEKVESEIRWGLSVDRALDVAVLAVRLYDGENAEDEDEAVEAAVKALQPHA